MSSGVSGNSNDNGAQGTFFAPEQQKTSYKTPLLWILGGAAAASALAYLYFRNEENDNPHQLADFSSLLTDIAVGAGAVAASIASVPLAIYATIMAAKNNQVSDLSNRDMQDIGNLPADLRLQLEEAYQSAPPLKGYKPPNDRRRNRNSKRDWPGNNSQNSSQGRQSRSKEKRAGSGISPMVPKTGDIALNSGTCLDGYSTKVLSDGNVATACARTDRIRLNIDDSAGSSVLAATPISTNGDDVANPALVQESSSGNIAVAWDQLDTTNIIQYAVFDSQGQSIKSESQAFNTNTLFFHMAPQLGIKGTSFFTSNAGRSSVEWQEFNSLNGNLVGSLKSFPRTSDFAMRRMGMVEAANGNMIAMYEDGDTVMKRQAFTSAGVATGANHNLGNSQGPDMVTVGSKSFGVRKSGSNIFLDKLNEDGTADGGSVTVATDATGNPRIATNGNFIAVAYQAPDGSGNGAFARIYDKNGAPIEDAFCANDNTVGEQTEPQLSWTPDGGLTVFFKDSSGIPTMRTFEFNSPPVPNSVPPETVFINQPFSKTYAAGDLATDPDGHTIAFTDEGGVAWGAFNDTSLTLDVTAPPGSQGNHNWSFGGNDGFFNGTFSGGQIPIYVANRAPTITGDATVSGFPLEQMGPVCLTTSDLDLDTPLTTGMTGQGALNGTDCWTFTPGSDDVGTGTVNATVTDPLGAKGFHLFDWTVNNRNPFVDKGFGNHNVTVGDSFAIAIAGDAYGDLDGHATSVTSFGAVPGWMIPNIGSQSMTGSAPGSAVGQTFDVHPTVCDTYSGCITDTTGSITVQAAGSGGNALPTKTSDLPQPNSIGSGLPFSYQVDVRNHFVDSEGDPLIATIGAPAGGFPAWFNRGVTNNTVVRMWGDTPADYTGLLTATVNVKDDQHTTVVPTPVTFNFQSPEQLAPIVDELVGDMLFDVGSRKYVQLPDNAFISQTGGDITLSLAKKSAKLDTFWSSHRKVAWLKLEQMEDSNGNMKWFVGGNPGKKATNGVKATLTGCDQNDLCSDQEFTARVDGMSPLEEFAAFGGPVLLFTIGSAGAGYWFKRGRTGKWKEDKAAIHLSFTNFKNRFRRWNMERQGDIDTSNVKMSKKKEKNVEMLDFEKGSGCF